MAHAVHKARAGLCGECAFEVHVDATGNRNEGGRARGTLDVVALTILARLIIDFHLHL